MSLKENYQSLNKTLDDLETSFRRLPRVPEPVPWPNEVPPYTFQQLKLVPDRLVKTVVNNGIKKEGLCEVIDRAQRDILRSNRVARVYLNPTATVSTPQPKKEMNKDVLRQEKAQRHQHTKEEDLANHHLRERRLAEMFHTYDLPFTKNKHTSLHKKSRGPFCHTALRLPPFSGPQALTATPDMMNRGPVKTKYFQVTPNNMTAYPLPPAISRMARKYRTTTAALWRQNRFKTPDGIEYRELQEQVNTAKYKAMACAVPDVTNPRANAIRGARIWSTYDPKIEVIHNMDCQDIDQDSMEKQSAQRLPNDENGDDNEDDNKGKDEEDGRIKEDRSFISSQGLRKERERKAVMRDFLLENKPAFDVGEKYMEDLITSGQQSRQMIKPLVTYQDMSTFRKHPKDTKKFKHCECKTDVQLLKARLTALPTPRSTPKARPTPSADASATGVSIAPEETPSLQNAELEEPEVMAEPEELVEQQE